MTAFEKPVCQKLRSECWSKPHGHIINSEKDGSMVFQQGAAHCIYGTSCRLHRPQKSPIQDEIKK